MRRGFAPVALVVVVLLIAAGVAGFYFLNSTQTQNTIPTGMDNSMQMPEKPSEGTFTSSDMPENEHYVEYSPQVLTYSSGTRRVLFFYANWCPICRPADTEFQSRVNEIPQDVTLIRVNFNDSDTDADEEALANKYAITYQHTFVQIDKDGNEVAKWNGGGLDQLLSNLQ